MSNADPENPSDANEPTQNIDGYSIIEELSDQHVEELYGLIQRQWRGGRRSLEDVKLMAANTSLMLGLVDTSSEQFVGFCRILTVLRVPRNDLRRHGHRRTQRTRTR
jgi:hypothetical protein